MTKPNFDDLIKLASQPVKSWAKTKKKRGGPTPAVKFTEEFKESKEFHEMASQ